MKKRGLVISWYYPPGNSSEGLVTYKLLKNSGFEYDVFTRKSHHANMWDRETNESELTATNITIYQASTNDEKEWVKEAVEFFEKNKDKYDFVMSRVMPIESHLAAYEIKRRFPDVFWAASFGDPLVNSPYVDIIEKGENPYFLKKYYLREGPSVLKTVKLAISPTRHARKRVWEKERVDDMRWQYACKETNELTFAKADLLIFNNPYQVKVSFRGGYARFSNKQFIVNHGFDLDLYPNVQNHDDEKIHFVYVGHLDAMRNSKALLDGIGKLKKYDEKLADKIVFDFYGHIDDGDKVAIVDNEIGDLVHLHADVSYITSLQKIMEADWLVLIDANLNTELDEYIYFPAKLVDYFGAKKNILAITQLKGASADAVREVGAGQIVTHSADEIAMYLSKIIYKDYAPADYNNKDAWGKYNIKSIAKRFDEKILSCLRNRQAGREDNE